MHEPTLVPAPTRVSWGGGWHTPPDSLGGRLKTVLRSTPDADLADALTCKRHGRLGDEAYELEVTPRRIVLRYGGDRGRLWAFRTLAQIVRMGSEGRIRCCTVADEPDYPVRAVMLDVSRDRVPQMETLYSLIDLWSSLKINQLQLYIEHTFAYSGHEEVWAHSSPFTADEIRAVSRYCRERGIDLVPNQNSFGHMERWLKHDAYKHLAECPGGFTDFCGVFRPAGTCLSPAVPGTMEFVGGLFDELLPSFDAGIFNVGGDEPWELCQGRSAARCAERGHGQVYVDFLKRLHAEVSKRGYRMQCFGDIITQHPELVPELPKELVVLDWGYEADHPFEEESALFADAGLDFFLLTGTSSWNSFGGRWQNARENIRKAAETGLRRGAAGFMITDWGDNGHTQQLPVSLAAWTYAAAVSWGGAENRDLDVGRALALHPVPASGAGVPGPEAGATAADEAGAAASGAGQQAADAVAEALMALGDSYLAEPVRLHNGTVVAATLLRGLTPYYEEELAACEGASFEPVRASLQRVHSALGKLREPLSREHTLFRREIDWTVSMLELGTSLAEELYTKGAGEPRNVPASRRGELAAELDPLLDEYQELWHSRSRPGGLKESVSKLRMVERELKEA